MSVSKRERWRWKSEKKITSFGQMSIMVNYKWVLLGQELGLSPRRVGLWPFRGWWN